MSICCFNENHASELPGLSVAACTGFTFLWEGSSVAKKATPINKAQELYLARQAADRGECPDDDVFREQYPSLWELCTTWWLDEKHRIEACRIEVICMTGEWVFKLHSPSMRASKTVTVARFNDGLTALEAVVNDGSRPWQFWLKRKAAVSKIEPSKDGVDIGQKLE
jgi:hypothetical protein